MDVPSFNLRQEGGDRILQRQKIGSIAKKLIAKSFLSDTQQNNSSEENQTKA